MQRPPWRDFLFGHRASVWLATGTLAVSTFAWLSHAGSWLVPLVALAARNTAVSARQRVTRWRRWTEAWEEMEGAPQATPTPVPSASRPPAPPASVETRRIPPSRYALRRTGPRSVPVIAWLLLVGYFTVRRNETQTPGDGVLAILLVALTIWAALAAVASLGRRVLVGRVDSPAQGEPSSFALRASEDRVRDEFVTQCLPIAGNEAPSLPIRDLLPDYARALLARSREPHHSATTDSNTESEKST